MPGGRRSLGLAALLAALCLLGAWAAVAQAQATGAAPGPLAATTAPAAAATPRGASEVTEARRALVIGNAAYKLDPLDNPVNDARLIAGALRKSGFTVSLHENLDRTGMLNAVRDFGAQLDERTIAVVYYAGHGLQLRDRNYLIPVDAEIRTEDEIPIAGLDLGFLLGRMSHAKSRVNIVILDACRNNPFAGRGGPTAQGLAQMDAPVGTLLAYATAPGKLAADGPVAGGNSLYAGHLGRAMLLPGLPVEHVFKRVREAVVRDTGRQQVPWESSSLQGEFAFVPGATSTAGAATADVEAAGELAFWQSIQGAQRADEYRAYLRQYPNGRFAALAQTRVAAYTPAPGGAAGLGAQSGPGAGGPSGSGGAGGVGTGPAAGPRPATLAAALPRVGDTWRYRVQDQFRIGDLYLTARVDQVGPDGVAESWSTTSDAKLRTVVAPLGPSFVALPGWTLTPPEFAPYLQAAGADLQPGQRVAQLQRRIEDVAVGLVARVAGVEEVSVTAGRFRATKLVLKGQSATRGGRGAVSTEQVVWYAPEVRRVVKTTVSTMVGKSVMESTTVELMEYRVN